MPFHPDPFSLSEGFRVERWPYPDVDATAARYVAASGAELRQFLAAHAGHMTARYYGSWLGELYPAGAEAVWVAELEDCDPVFTMVHAVVVELPHDPAGRDRVLAAAAAIARTLDPGGEPGVDP